MENNRKNSTMYSQKMEQLIKTAYQKGFQEELEKKALFGISSRTFGLRAGIRSLWGKGTTEAGKRTIKAGLGEWAERSLGETRTSNIRRANELTNAKLIAKQNAEKENFNRLETEHQQKLKNIRNQKPTGTPETTSTGAPTGTPETTSTEAPKIKHYKWNPEASIGKNVSGMIGHYWNQPAIQQHGEGLIGAGIGYIGGRFQNKLTGEAAAAAAKNTALKWGAAAGAGGLGLGAGMGMMRNRQQ
jgi:hypothetical protein